MATDAALLDLSVMHGIGYLRLYQWRPHCLSFGRHEPARRRYRRDRIATLGIDVVRRPTGGRAVWHGRELTYAVTAPEDAFGSLRQAYQTIHEMLAAALRSLGADTTLADVSLPPAEIGAGACFASPVGGEVLIDGGKVIGSAQIRHSGGLLQHGSILLDDDQEILTELTIGAAPASRALPLNRALATRTTADQVAERVAAAARAWPGTWEDDHLIAERHRLAAVHAERFRDPDWTWCR
jgi:lipoate-protein ligase A